MKNAGIRFAILGILLGILAVTAGVASQSRPGPAYSGVPARLVL